MKKRFKNTTVRWFNRAYAKTAVGLFLCVLLAITSASAQDYYAIIDAGSSGSRIYLYKADKEKATDLPEITQVCSYKVTPGLSSLYKHPEFVFSQIKYLLESVKFKQGAALKVLEQKREKIPLYLMATAGLRLMDKQAQQDLMMQIKMRFSNDHIFDFKEALVLSGRYEGLYSWLASNYLNDRFNPKTPNDMVIEMGGASMQISQAGTTPKHAIRRTIQGRNYKISALSYLGLGQDQIMNVFDKNGLNKYLQGRGFDNACRQIKQALNNKCAKANGKLRAATKRLENLLAQRGDYRKALSGLKAKNKAYTWNELVLTIQRLSDTIRKHENQVIEHARSNASYCLNTKFKVTKDSVIAVSAFYYTFDFFGLLKSNTGDNTKNGGVLTLKSLRQKGKEIYQKGWAKIGNATSSNQYWVKTLKSTKGNEALARKRLKSYYFNLAYFYTLFDTLFDFGKGEEVKIHALTKKKDNKTKLEVEPSWTLGAVIDIALGYKPEKD